MNEFTEWLGKSGVKWGLGGLFAVALTCSAFIYAKTGDATDGAVRIGAKTYRNNSYEFITRFAPVDGRPYGNFQLIARFTEESKLVKLYGCTIENGLIVRTKHEVIVRQIEETPKYYSVTVLNPVLNDGLGVCLSVQADKPIDLQSWYLG